MKFKNLNKREEGRFYKILTGYYKDYKFRIERGFYPYYNISMYTGEGKNEIVTRGFIWGGHLIKLYKEALSEMIDLLQEFKKAHNIDSKEL